MSEAVDDAAVEVCAAREFATAIHYAQKWDEKLPHEAERLSVVFEVAKASVVLVAPVAYGLTVLFPAISLRPVGGILLVMYFGFFFVVATRSVLYRRKLRDLPERSDPRHRIRCRGRAVDLLGDRDVRDVPFEPYMTPHLLPPDCEPATGLFWLALFAVVGTFFYGCTTSLSGGGQAGDMLRWVVVSSTAMFGATVLTGLLWPTYICIVPGRVEFWRRFVFSNRFRPGRFISLRHARIRIDLLESLVVLTTAGKRHTVIPLLLMPRPKEFLYHLIMGAVSSQTAAPTAAEEL